MHDCILKKRVMASGADLRNLAEKRMAEPICQGKAPCARLCRRAWKFSRNSKASRIMEKMQKKIDNWRGKALSKAASHIDMWPPKRK
ncbi:hypothetical protein ASF03_20515 [Rhizobium sp. Leaf68]|nr:hypothetical protein ASE62_18780 [Rhizobium sp. Leaf202]KQN81029.1 hypothetical protein ASF03_20515 [Rhizobium sp. Leaf68]